MPMPLSSSYIHTHRDRVRTIFQQLQFTEDNRWVEGSTVPLELTGASAITLSPSGQYTLLFKEEVKTEVSTTDAVLLMMMA